MLNHKARLFIIGFWNFIVLTSLFSGVSHLVKAEIIENPSQLIEAHKALQNAFVAVLEAEHDGVNIADLLSNLNSAADLLAQAEMSFRNGYVERAIEEVANVSNITSEVKTEALNAQHLALINRDIAFVTNVASSFGGGFSLILILYLFWIWYKQRYLKRLKTSKQEVRTVDA